MEEEDLYSSVYWKVGFYFNPKNPKIFIPKRMGIGWTMNFGRWQSYMVIGILIGLIFAIQFFIKY